MVLVTSPRTCRSVLVIAMERSDRSNLIASNTCFFGLLRYARNDKLVLHLLATSHLRTPNGVKQSAY